MMALILVGLTASMLAPLALKSILGRGRQSSSGGLIGGSCGIQC